jgi:ribonuclease HI
MKYLKFDHHLAGLIADGQKTKTFRLFDDKNIKLNDQLLLVDKVEADKPDTWLVIGQLNVTSVTEKNLSSLKPDDWDGHENYIDETDFLDTFKRYYGDAVTPDTPVKIIEFIYHKLPKQAYSKKNIEASPLTDSVKLYADGGSRGNPGPSAGGFVVIDSSQQIILESGKYLGITTNNQAEYHALKGGLEACLKLGVSKVDVYMDSLLVVNQMKGSFKVKNRELWSIHNAIKQIATNFKEVKYTHVPRELNKLADAEVNKVLDAIKEANELQ